MQPKKAPLPLPSVTLIDVTDEGINIESKGQDAKAILLIRSTLSGMTTDEMLQYAKTFSSIWVI